MGERIQIGMFQEPLRNEEFVINIEDSTQLQDSFTNQTFSPLYMRPLIFLDSVYTKPLNSNSPMHDRRMETMAKRMVESCEAQLEIEEAEAQMCEQSGQLKRKRGRPKKIMRHPLMVHYKCSHSVKRVNPSLQPNETS
jgi:hypothetical protein